MNISGPFIRRPVGTALLTVAVALAGATAFGLLPVSPLPQIDFPTISVSAGLPGASPATVASSIATPLERQLGHIAAVSEMTSSSNLGSTSITLQFALDRNIDAAARDVQAAINAARGYLPANLPTNPSYRKVNPSDAPILILALTSDALSRGAMYDAASTIMAQSLSQVDGVGQVTVGGSTLPAVRIELMPAALHKYSLGFEDVRAALAASNANTPKGQLDDGKRTFEVNTTDQLLTAAEYQPLIVAYQHGAPVRISDLGQAVDSVEDLRNAGFSRGKPSVLVVVSREPGANIIDTVDAVLARLPQLKAAMPSSINVAVAMDQTKTIRASVHDVEVTLMIAVALVVLVVFAFLRSPRATLIPSVAVPVSLIGTFGVMYLLGYSLDNLSLMALTISTGFVVDDAIVVIENISRYLEQGMRPIEAALRGASEIGFTVVTITVSLVAVFIPLLLMGGIVGRLLHEFAMTLAIAIVISMLVSLTTTPAMAAYMLRRETGHGRLFRASERFFTWLSRTYERTLNIALDFKFITLTIFLITIGLNVYLFVHIPKGFFPQQDTGRLNGNLQADQDTSFQAMQDRLLRVIDIVKDDPAVDNVVGFTGSGGGTSTTNSARMFISLKPLEERGASAEQVIARLRPEMNAIRGVSSYLQAAQDVRVGGRQSNAQYQFSLRSQDVEDIVKAGPQMLAKLQAIDLLTDVNTDQQNQGLRSQIQYDREAASRYNISPQLIDNSLYDAFGQRQVSTMYRAQNQYHVVMEAAPQYTETPLSLNDLYIRNPNGLQVPLSNFARYAPATAPLSVTHQGLFPSATMSFNLKPGVALGEAVTAIENAAEELNLPSSIQTSFAGTAQAYQASLSTEPLLITAALITVYIVLGILYESFVHPITILSTLPSAGVGALLALMLFHVDLSLIAMIGIILLIGIVKKNGILIVDFALAAERVENKNSRDAIVEACVLRFRPILMTTLAAALGALPLAIDRGMGSEMRRPLGIAIIGGLIVSQVLTLYTTPVVYLFMDKLRAGKGSK